jgi:hypothetical protein
VVALQVSAMMSTPQQTLPTALQVKTVKFGDGPLGIGLTDFLSFREDASPGADEQYSTSVQRFNPLADGSAGVAETSGLVDIGDLLVAVNGVDTAGSSKEELLNLVASSARPVELGFRRPGAMALEVISPIPSTLASSPALSSPGALEPRRRAQVYAKLVQDFSNMQDALTASHERNAQLERDLIAAKSAAELGRRQVLLLKSEHSSALAQIKGAYADSKSKHHAEATEREAEVSALHSQLSALRTELRGELDTQSRRAEAATSDLAAVQGELAAALASRESLMQTLEGLRSAHSAQIASKESALRDLSGELAKEKLQREMIEQEMAHKHIVHASQVDSKVAEMQAMATALAR